MTTFCAREIANMPRDRADGSEDNGLCESRTVTTGPYALHGGEGRCRACGLPTCMTYGPPAKHLTYERSTP